MGIRSMLLAEWQRDNSVAMGAPGPLVGDMRKFSRFFGEKQVV